VKWNASFKIKVFSNKGKKLIHLPVLKCQHLGVVINVDILTKTAMCRMQYNVRKFQCNSSKIMTIQCAGGTMVTNYTAVADVALKLQQPSTSSMRYYLQWQCVHRLEIPIKVPVTYIRHLV
jgi:hypothetical protein